MEFKDRLKELREKKGLTQSQFADAITNYQMETGLSIDNVKVSTQTVSYWENGREPSFGMLIKLSSFLGVSTDYLLGNSDVADVDENYYINSFKELDKEKIDNLINDFPPNLKSGFHNMFSQLLMLINSIFDEGICDLDRLYLFTKTLTLLALFIDESYTPFIDTKSASMKKKLLHNDVMLINDRITFTITEFSKILNESLLLVIKRSEHAINRKPENYLDIIFEEAKTNILFKDEILKKNIFFKFPEP